MRAFLIAGCALAMGVGGCSPSEEAETADAPAAPAASAPAPDAGPPGGFGPLGDQTLDQMLERSRASFARMDQDGDGKVTAEEREAMRAQFGGGEGRGPGRGGAMIARADADGDGQVTLAEMEAQARARFERMDADGNGTVTADERRAAFERMRGGG
ncbi:EF-hand domain-containing protein [Phenylobacterium terrae]|uniref:EF-hand domain-containing protein n=1 Tax=Phenylobacterium terrae TaxID=2665495 RepID=A0ABW4N5V6_9CAUL